MGDIPDWLVELAAQRDEEGDEAEETEWDILRDEDTSAEAASPFPEQGEAVPVETSPEIAAEAPGADTADLDEGELIDVLRSQVETDEETSDVVPSAAGERFALRIPGLLPWQQLVLAVLLLLDVIVIGLLALVMLGRIAIG